MFHLGEGGGNCSAVGTHCIRDDFVAYRRKSSGAARYDVNQVSEPRLASAGVCVCVRACVRACVTVYTHHLPRVLEASEDRDVLITGELHLSFNKTFII